MEVKVTQPLLPLRDIVVFPSMVIPLFVGRDKSITALNEVMKGDKKIVLVTQKNSEVDEPTKNDVYSFGCESTILQLLKLPDGTVKVLVEGIKRVKIIDFKDDQKYISGTFEYQKDIFPKEEEDLMPLALTAVRRLEKLTSNSIMILMENIKTSHNQKLLKNLFVIVLGSIFLTISAKIKIPFYPVPMTMQTFVVLFLGISLGYKLAIATVGLYLLEGILGIPVFSNSPEKGIGLIYFTGPTMGYLIGFLFAAFFSGYFNFKNENILLIFIKLVFSVSFIYIFGIIWLGILIGWDKPLLSLGVNPFLYAELFKMLILSLLAKNIFKIKNFI